MSSSVATAATRAPASTQPQAQREATSKNPAALAQEYQNRRQELQGLAQKLGELESDADEHRLVIQTLEATAKTQPERKCFRLLGGVLVEKTVVDVVPSLKQSEEGLKQVMSTLIEQYKQKEEQLAAFQREHVAGDRS